MFRSYFTLITVVTWVAVTLLPQPTTNAQFRDLTIDESSFGEQPIPRFKKQAVQSVSLSAGGLLGLDNDLNSTFWEVSMGLGVPLGSFDNILGVTPMFRMDSISAAANRDVPQQLYETGVSFFYRRPLNDRFSLMAIAAPSIRSDFTTGDNAFRLFGLGLVNWECRPEELTLSFGAVFLDRADLPLLPAIGLSWTPAPGKRLDLRFPESKFSWRLQRDGNRSETTGYVTAGLGGNTWAVTRADGATDELSLRDIRLMLGIDHLTNGGGGWFAEVGYAFGRRIEYESTQTEFDLSNGILLQAGWRY